MAAVTETKCKSCGTHHELCLHNADVFEPGALYQYACPQTGERVELLVDDWNKIAAVCPEESIRVQPAG